MTGLPRRTLLARGAAALGLVAAGPARAESEQPTHRVTIIFVEFYRKTVKLEIDGRTLFNGMLDVIDRSIEIAAWMEADLGGQCAVHFVCDDVEQRYSFDVTPAHRWMLVGPRGAGFTTVQPVFD